MHRQKRFFRVALALAMEYKSQRDIAGGVLRYAAAHPDWEVRIFSSVQLESSVQFGQVRPTANELWRPDGLILGAHTATFRRPWHVPLVVLDPVPGLRLRPEGIVLTGDAAIGTAAADFLLAKRFTSFAYAATQDPDEHHHCRARERAFADRLKQSGFACRHLDILDPNDRDLRPTQRLIADLNSLEKPCALFAYSDIAARYVLDACRYADIAVPDAISILGVDNANELTENTNPPLSSVLPDFERSGFEAARMMDAFMRGEEPPVRKTTTGVISVIDRQSTNDPSGAHRIVHAALDYIRQHFSERLRTKDLARRLGMSSRLLEIRFREALGQTVHEKISECRLQEAERLVTKSERPFSTIAEACGYASQQGLRKAFLEKFGCTMREWRNRRHSV